MTWCNYKEKEKNIVKMYIFSDQLHQIEVLEDFEPAYQMQERVNNASFYGRLVSELYDIYVYVISSSMKEGAGSLYYATKEEKKK